MIRTRNLFLAGAAAVLALGAQTANAVVVLDDLATATGPVLDGGVSTGPASAAGADILGGTRVLSVTRTSGAGLVAADVALSIAPGFSYASGVGTAGVATLEYDGDGTAGITPTGLGGIDITSGGTVFGLIGEFRSDLGAELHLHVFDIMGGTSSAVLAIPALGATTTFSGFAIPFLSLVGTADLTKIGAVQLDLDGSATPETDVALRFLRFDNPVPEPGAVAMLLGAGVAGSSLLLRRRNRR